MAKQQDPVLNSRLLRTANFQELSDGDTRYRWFYKRACGAHWAYRTERAVSANSNTLPCPVCHPMGYKIYIKCVRAMAISPGEENLWVLLVVKFPGQLVWSVQDIHSASRDGTDS